MRLFRMFYRVAAVIGITVILTKVFDVSFSLWWFIPLVIFIWVVTEIRAAYVQSMVKEKHESDNDGSDKQEYFVDLKEEPDGTWEAPLRENQKPK